MSKHHGIEDRRVLRVARVVDQTNVLGPGARAVVLVQGCMLRCEGCIAAATHPLDGGVACDVERLADRLGDLPGLEGVTYSGGEPFLQASALSTLTDLLRQQRPELSFMSYSGYRVEWLREHGSVAQHSLLDQLDVLVDGPYVKRWHAPLRWRGSSNQRLIPLTSRHVDDLLPDEPVGVELEIDDDLELSWVGVPHRPDFGSALERAVGELTAAGGPA